MTNRLRYALDTVHLHNMAGIFQENIDLLTAMSSKENLRPRSGRGRSSRPVLGNVTNQLRVQPQRLAKGKGLKQVHAQDTEDLKKSVEPAGFTIFQDQTAHSQVESSQSDVPMADQENCLLDDAIACFNRIGRPQLPHVPSNIGFLHHEGGFDSPMVVDEINASRVTNQHRLDEFGLEPYFKDIYNYLRSIETAARPKPGYMSCQNDISISMRNILVDWLVEVGEEYKLQRETLFLAVSYIDRFLSLVRVVRPKLQLVGTTCMFIAAKFEEIYPPDVAEFVYITDDSYTCNQVLKMESVILKVLEFKTSVPTINWFCDRFNDCLGVSDKTKFLSHLLTELSLIELEEFLVFPPSLIAASAVSLASCIMKAKDPWPKHTEEMSGYTLVDLKHCMRQLFSLYARKDSMNQQAVNEKYKQDKYLRVSFIEVPRILAVF